MQGSGHPAAQAFFDGSGAHRRFCLYHASAGPARGALVYLHPFAEEMNRSRHVAAQLARTLAAQGTAVLLIDLHGCGDSAGDFEEARWDSWKHDVARACALLAERCGVWPGVLGLRLGALLALDYAHNAARAPQRVVLWQPVTSGAAYLTQFLRLRTAHAMLAGGGAETTDALRARLHADGAVEVAGYMLAAPLAAAIDALDAVTLAPGAADWFEVAPAAGRAPSPATLKVADAWRARGCALQLHGVGAAPFWSTAELADAGALVRATAQLLGGGAHAD